MVPRVLRREVIKKYDIKIEVNKKVVIQNVRLTEI